MNANNKPLLPLIILFVILNGFFFTSKAFLLKHGIDNNIMIISNSLLFILTVITFFMQQRALNDKNPNVFFRAIMSSLLLKLFLCAAIVLIYAKLSGNGFSKRSVFISMLLYLVYMAIEVKAVFKLNKQKNV